jgi:hypothetical protein
MLVAGLAVGLCRGGDHVDQQISASIDRFWREAVVRSPTTRSESASASF